MYEKTETYIRKAVGDNTWFEKQMLYFHKKCYDTLNYPKHLKKQSRKPNELQLYIELFFNGKLL